MVDPDVFEQEVYEGRGRPVPDYVAIVQEARFWRITPMEVLEMPMEWIRAGRIVREAEAQAQQQLSARHTR